MATILRAPVVTGAQPKRWLGTPDAFPNLLATTLAPPPATFGLPLSAGRSTDSAPARKRAVQVDPIPNALSWLIDTSQLAAVQVYGSAPIALPRLSVDAYPNLLASTLAPPATPYALPLSAGRIDASASPPKRPVIAQQFEGRPVWLDPVPAFAQWTASAPWRKYTAQVDVYPNITVLGINPNPTPMQWSDSAPPPKRPVYVDIYANLTVSTLASFISVPDVTGETQAQGITDLQSAGFVVSVSTSYSDLIPAGIIISQIPVGGSQSIVGATVTITVSLGHQPIQSSGHGRARTQRELEDRIFRAMQLEPFDPPPTVGSGAPGEAVSVQPSEDDLGPFTQVRDTPAVSPHSDEAEIVAILWMLMQ